MLEKANATPFFRDRKKDTILNPEAFQLTQVIPIDTPNPQIKTLQ